MENKNFNTGIYQIVNLVNGKRYIGSATFLKKRGKQHFTQLKNNYHPNKYLQRAFNKYGIENFKFEILLYCDKKDLLFYEQRAIDAYDFENELYNLSPTAGSTIGVKRRQDSIEKQRIKMTGRKFTEEHRNNMSKALKGKIKTPEHIENNRQSQIGRITSIETRKKISIAGKNQSPEINKKKGRKGDKNHNFGKHGKDNLTSKALYQIDRNTNEIIKRWESTVEASKNTNIDHSSISKACRGERQTIGGFKWAYVKDYENKKGEQI